MLFPASFSSCSILLCEYSTSSGCSLMYLSVWSGSTIHSTIRSACCDRSLNRCAVAFFSLKSNFLSSAASFAAASATLAAGRLVFTIDLDTRSPSLLSPMSSNDRLFWAAACAPTHHTTALHLCGAVSHTTALHLCGDPVGKTSTASTE